MSWTIWPGMTTCLYALSFQFPTVRIFSALFHNFILRTLTWQIDIYHRTLSLDKCPYFTKLETNACITIYRTRLRRVVLFGLLFTNEYRLCTGTCSCKDLCLGYFYMYSVAWTNHCMVTNSVPLTCFGQIYGPTSMYVIDLQCVTIVKTQLCEQLKCT